MPDEERDRELGMDRAISRRDFLNGVAVGIGGALASQPMLAALAPSEPPAAAKAADYYPSIQNSLGNDFVSYVDVIGELDSKPCVLEILKGLSSRSHRGNWHQRRRK